MPPANGVNGDNVRLLRVTAGNLRQSHLYVKGHYDFFPADCVGGSKRSSAAERSIEIRFDGLGESITTDLGSHAKSGKPRRFLRARSALGRFYKHHGVQAGTFVALQRLAIARRTLECGDASPLSAWH